MQARNCIRPLVLKWAGSRAREDRGHGCSADTGETQRNAEGVWELQWAIEIASSPCRFLVKDGEKKILLPVEKVDWIETSAFHCVHSPNGSSGPPRLRLSAANVSKYKGPPEVFPFQRRKRIPKKIFQQTAIQILSICAVGHNEYASLRHVKTYDVMTPAFIMPLFKGDFAIIRPIKSPAQPIAQTNCLIFCGRFF
jgi:hypothetical protein